jgi:hypothetical protein
MVGRPEQAHKAVARLRELSPTLRLSNLKDVLGPYRRAEDVARPEAVMGKRACRRLSRRQPVPRS